MLKAIAIDDEPVALEVIKALATKITFINMAAYFTNAFEASQFLQQEVVDLIFLDIKMPDITGIDFVKSLPRPPLVIFTTAYSEHAVQSFELDAIDYLLKPFSQARFLKACNKAYEQYTLKNKISTNDNFPTHIFIKSGVEQIRVELAAILYVESCGNYMQFVLEGKKITSRLTMNESEALLPAADFLRIHRSFIVAKNRITKVSKHSLFINQTELPVGAGYANTIEAITK